MKILILGSGLLQAGGAFLCIPVKYEEAAPGNLTAAHATIDSTRWRLASDSDTLWNAAEVNSCRARINSK